ncbi:hypothetical protein H5410_014307 [Solanum commersonii]|uniref:Uncharacterized protein n=1 Tax=Solanum commersonii TaxID=4109 RepID=A0A9J5ZQV0_SOLCO|nr:hypothetical protein H5410_014307 [Solanum commersonii]
MAKIHRTSELGQHSLKVVWHNEVVGLIHVVDVVKNTQEGHFMKECPKNKHCSENPCNRAQSSSITPPDRAAPREAIFDNGGGANRL